MAGEGEWRTKNVRADMGRPVNSIAEDSGGTRGNSIVSMLGAAIA